MRMTDIDITNALLIPGWMTPAELSWLAEQARTHQAIAEIGSWRGRSARVLADNTSGRVLCVDTWDDHAIGLAGWWTEQESRDKYAQPDWLLKEFIRNTAGPCAEKLDYCRLPSLEAAAASQGRSFDMIFIDAGHSFHEVCADIRAWQPLLRAGGLLCGHDYQHPLCPEVAPAVKALLPAHANPVGTIWAVP